MYANMRKIYLKDSNGKYKIVDRDKKGQSVIFEHENQKKTLSQDRTLSLEEKDARLKRLEAICIGPQK